MAKARWIIAIMSLMSAGSGRETEAEAGEMTETASSGRTCSTGLSCGGRAGGKEGGAIVGMMRVFRFGCADGWMVVFEKEGKGGSDEDPTDAGLKRGMQETMMCSVAQRGERRHVRKHVGESGIGVYSRLEMRNVMMSRKQDGKNEGKLVENGMDLLLKICLSSTSVYCPF